MNGPSPHLSWNELACVNRTGRPWKGFAPGEVVADYPMDWRETRAVVLAETFEAVRVLVGGPLLVLSSYRPHDYNAAIGGARRSQHLEGRALDLAHPHVSAMELAHAIRRLHKQGGIPHLGGIGQYRRFVHIDTRPHAPGRLVAWTGYAEAA